VIRVEQPMTRSRSFSSEIARTSCLSQERACARTRLGNNRAIIPSPASRFGLTVNFVDVRLYRAGAARFFEAAIHVKDVAWKIRHGKNRP